MEYYSTLLIVVYLSLSVDAVVHGFSAGCVGYLAVLHAQLFDQQPALAFLPLFVIGLVAHFFIRARSTDTSKTEAEVGQVSPLLPRDAKEGDKVARGEAAVLQGFPTSASPNHPDLDRDEDDYNLDSSSMYSSPLEDEDEDQDWDSSDIYESYGDSEVDPGLFLELQQDYQIQEEDLYSHPDEDQTPFGKQDSQRSASPEVLSRPARDNLYPDLRNDGVWQSSGASSDYNTISDLELQDEGSGYDDL